MHAELIVEQGANAGNRFVIRPGQRFTIGRRGTSAVLAGDSAVSRSHARVELQDGRVTVADLNSRNGTYLGAEPLKPYVPTPVGNGAAIEIGAHLLRVVIHPDDDDTRRARERARQLDEPLLPRDEIELLGEIGAGAYGRVYAAYQKLMDRRVAVKVLFATGEAGLERFLQEGRLACRVRSPHVVEVYNFRFANDRVCLVMELVDGVTLKDRLKATPALAIPEVLRIGEEVAVGLAAVHLEGIVHRDVKPSNILLTAAGTAKLADFGVAKDLTAAGGLTPEEVGFGSLPYVSPEQATSAGSVDVRADVYGLGATLYHMVAGRPPFSGSRGLSEHLTNIATATPAPLASLNQACPDDLDRLVGAMLHKDPNARPPSAASVVRQLAELRRMLYPTTLDDDRRMQGEQTGRLDRERLNALMEEHDQSRRERDAD